LFPVSSIVNLQRLIIAPCKRYDSIVLFSPYEKKFHVLFFRQNHDILLGISTMTGENLLREKRDDVIALIAKHGALNPRIFGSVARGESTPESDIDLLVKMEEGRSLLDLTALKLDLNDLLGVKVEVVSEDGLYWLLRRRILKEAKPL
jgi:hypothetical protein